jgi:uncharacterized protein
MSVITDLRAFVSRYVAVWNEGDAVLRCEAVVGLWDEGGTQFTDDAEYRGHDAIQGRVAAAYEQFVSAEGLVFVAGDDVSGHHGTGAFSMHLVTPAGVPVWSCSVFVLFGQDGGIQRDYQFTGRGAGTRATVAEFLRRLGEGDPDRIAALFADVVDWQLDWPVERHAAVPWIRPRTTRADVADHFRTLDAFHVPEGRGGTVASVLVDGADAVVLGDIRQTVRATGRAYVARFALYVTVVDGLIVRYHVYEDSLAVARAFGGY